MGTETVDPVVETTEPVDAAPSFDMESAVDKVSASLQSSLFTPDSPDAPVEAEPPATVTPVQSTPSTPLAPSLPEVPKSWTKEMQPHWTKLPPEVQAYWQTREQQMAEGSEKYRVTTEQYQKLRDVITPFEPLIRQYGLTPEQAIFNLLSAQRNLTQGTEEQRRAVYEALGKELRIVQPSQNGTPPPPLDPAVLSLQQRVDAFEADQQARRQAEQHARAEQARQSVDAFAADPAHQYFNEVYNEMIPFLKEGLSLDAAYKKAVGANELTFEKELQARLLTEQAKAAENARLDALPKVKAAKAHVRSVETRHTPKETIGTMEGTLKETLAEIRGRAH